MPGNTDDTSGVPLIELGGQCGESLWTGLANDLVSVALDVHPWVQCSHARFPSALSTTTSTATAFTSAHRSTCAVSQAKGRGIMGPLSSPPRVSRGLLLCRWCSR